MKIPSTPDSTAGWLLLIVVGGAIFLGLSGCSGRVQSAAVGKWQDESGKETMEFGEDGTLRGMDRYGRPISGKFEFVDKDHVRLEMTTTATDSATGNRTVDNAAGVCRLEVRGDSLTLTDDTGTATRYQRAK